MVKNFWVLRAGFFFIPPQGTQTSGDPRPKRFLIARPIFWVPCLGPLFGSPVWVHCQIHCKKIRKKFYSQIQCKKFRKKFYSQIHCKRLSKKIYSHIHCKKTSQILRVLLVTKKNYSCGFWEGPQERDPKKGSKKGTQERDPRVPKRGPKTQGTLDPSTFSVPVGGIKKNPACFELEL